MSASRVSSIDLHRALKDTFGYDTFRGSQERALLSILNDKRDTLVVMPTGGGKSLIYSLPTILRPRGLVLVVSPLIALVEDQMRILGAKNIPCEHLLSTHDAQSKARVLKSLEGSGVGSPAPFRVLFATPEGLDAQGAVGRALARPGVAETIVCVAIDEAHSISTWGHDFRPSYRRLSRLRTLLPGTPLVALTATATSRVRQDIVASLAMRDPLVLVSSFDRPEIHYSVRYVDLEERERAGGRPRKEVEEEDELCPPSRRSPPSPASASILALLPPPRGPSGRSAAAAGASEGQPGQPSQTLVYTRSRAQCEEIAAQLSRRGVAATPYHAGMSAAARGAALREWADPKGRCKVLVGTVAVGMGIDVATCRLVVHATLPASLENFYQESGRAGRDGQPSRSVLLFSEADRRAAEFLASTPDANGKKGPGAKGAKKGESSKAGASGGNGAAAPAALQSVIKAFTEPKCRRRSILAHFGEDLKKEGGNSGGGRCCDVCDNPTRAEAEARAVKSLREANEVAGRGAGGRKWALRGGLTMESSKFDEADRLIDVYEGDSEGLEDGEDRGPGIKLGDSSDSLGGSDSSGDSGEDEEGSGRKRKRRRRDDDSEEGDGSGSDSDAPSRPLSHAEQLSLLLRRGSKPSGAIKKPPPPGAAGPAKAPMGAPRPGASRPAADRAEAKPTRMGPDRASDVAAAAQHRDQARLEELLSDAEGAVGRGDAGAASIALGALRAFPVTLALLTASGGAAGRRVKALRSAGMVREEAAAVVEAWRAKVAPK